MALETDHDWMARALQLARQGLTTTTPNPRVGCVLVKDECMVGEGWHQRAGEAHAEVHALQAAGTQAEGATAYVTLEPCSHVGRTPPCVEALVAARVARVVVAMQDPNPRVSGQGLAHLRAAGIDVTCGVLAHEAAQLNLGFVSRMTRGRPWVRTKLAASVDGKTALLNGVSQWITSATARADGHAWRAQACAILTGVGTVQHDDPQLNVRAVTTSRQPLKIVVDSQLRTSLQARVLAGAPTWLAAATPTAARIATFRAAGHEVFLVPNVHGQVDLSTLMQTLAQREINEVWVEAGSTLNTALLQADVIDEILLYLAPRVLGAGRDLFALPALSQLPEKLAWKFIDVHMLGDDVRLRLQKNS